MGDRTVHWLTNFCANTFCEGLWYFSVLSGQAGEHKLPLQLGLVVVVSHLFNRKRLRRRLSFQRSEGIIPTKKCQKFLLQDSILIGLIIRFQTGSVFEEKLWLTAESIPGALSPPYIFVPIFVPLVHFGIQGCQPLYPGLVEFTKLKAKVAKLEEKVRLSCFMILLPQVKLCKLRFSMNFVWIFLHNNPPSMHLIFDR